MELVLGSATTSDNCSVAGTETHDGVDPYGAGKTIVTWTVVDASGNSNTCDSNSTSEYR